MLATNRPPKFAIPAAHEILKNALSESTRRPPARRTARAFITVSRQAGAGGVTFSHRLAQRLSELASAHWTAWDHELVDEVSKEHGIAKAVLEMIPYQSHTWFADLQQSFVHCEEGEYCDECSAYKRVTLTIGALATAGHTIIVGRGGRFVTAAIPGGIHLRLIAPLDHRIRFIAGKEQLTMDEAIDRIEEMDRNREMFYSRHWPGKTLNPETFSMTLNSAELSVDEMIDCVLPLVQQREPFPTNPPHPFSPP
jgi:cytidylate kinase